MKPATLAPLTVRMRQDPEAHQRIRMAELPADEAGEHRRGEPEERQGLAREPALLPGLGDRIDQRREASGHQHGAREVEPPDVRVAALPQEEGCDHERGHTYRDVDEEDPLPAERVGQDTSEEYAGHGTEAADGSPGTERDVALTPLYERRRQDRQRCRRDDRRAQALDGAGRDQRFVGPRHPGQQRGDREHGDPAEEDPPSTEDVGGPTAQEQEAAEDESVGTDHPLEIALREPEVHLDRGQRHVHDRDVEDDHELNDAQERQGQPRTAGGSRRAASSCFHSHDYDA